MKFYKTVKSKEDLVDLLQDIIQASERLKDTYTNEQGARVSYACIFTHSDKEYLQLCDLASQLGAVADDTATGLVYRVTGVDTAAGVLPAFKIRKADASHPDRGDADFTVTDFDNLKRSCLGREGFSLIVRPDCEMIELKKEDQDVRVYFSNPPYNL